jgi:hypothetical protein
MSYYSNYFLSPDPREHPYVQYRWPSHVEQSPAYYGSNPQQYVSQDKPIGNYPQYHTQQPQPQPQPLVAHCDGTIGAPALAEITNGSTLDVTAVGGVHNKGTRTASNLEKHALAALNRIFIGKTFEKIRPPWLRNPRTGRMCELDFYSDELKLGVEIQGMQHYVYPNSWHKSRSEWDEQVYRDRLKQQLCQRVGVTLLHVPFTVPSNKVEQFIREEIQRVTLLGSTLHTWLTRSPSS